MYNGQVLGRPTQSCPSRTSIRSESPGREISRVMSVPTGSGVMLSINSSSSTDSTGSTFNRFAAGCRVANFQNERKAAAHLEDVPAVRLGKRARLLDDGRPRHRPNFFTFRATNWRISSRSQSNSRAFPLCTSVVITGNRIEPPGLTCQV